MANLFDGITKTVSSASYPIMSGEDSFRLCDTFGLPFDMLQELLREKGMAFDWFGFCVSAAKAGWVPGKLKEMLLGEGYTFEKAPALFWAIPKAFDKVFGPILSN